MFWVGANEPGFSPILIFTEFWECFILQPLNSRQFTVKILNLFYEMHLVVLLKKKKKTFAPASLYFKNKKTA